MTKRTEISRKSNAGHIIYNINKDSTPSLDEALARRYDPVLIDNISHIFESGNTLAQIPGHGVTLIQAKKRKTPKIDFAKIDAREMSEKLDVKESTFSDALIKRREHDLAHLCTDAGIVTHDNFPISTNHLKFRQKHRLAGPISQYLGFSGTGTDVLGSRFASAIMTDLEGVIITFGESGRILVADTGEVVWCNDPTKMLSNTGKTKPQTSKIIQLAPVDKTQALEDYKKITPQGFPGLETVAKEYFDKGTTKRLLDLYSLGEELQKNPGHGMTFVFQTRIFAPVIEELKIDSVKLAKQEQTRLSNSDAFYGRMVTNREVDLANLIDPKGHWTHTNLLLPIDIVEYKKKNQIYGNIGTFFGFSGDGTDKIGSRYLTTVISSAYLRNEGAVLSFGENGRNILAYNGNIIWSNDQKKRGHWETLHKRIPKNHKNWYIRAA